MRKILVVVLTLAIPAAIVWQLDRPRLAEVFATLDWTWFAAGLLLFIPMYAILVSRLRFMTHDAISVRNALSSILAASSLNIMLPSKGGEVVKAVFVQRFVPLSLDECAAIIVLERVADFSALGVLMLIGLLTTGFTTVTTVSAGLIGAAILGATLVYFVLSLVGTERAVYLRWLHKVPKAKSLVDSSCVLVRESFRTRRIIAIYAFAFASWSLQLVQLFCFLKAVGYGGPAASVAALMPAAIVIGLMPITLAGFGTRDAAMIVLFAAWAPAEIMLAGALLSHLRYILPALAGILPLRRLAGAKDPIASSTAST